MVAPAPLVTTREAGLAPRLNGKASYVLCGDGQWRSNSSLGGGSSVPTTRTISTTAPLTGGGDLSADRTFAITSATLAGTANQVILSASGVGVLLGSTNITLSLPQSINSGASPTFSGVTLSGLTQGSVLFAGAGGAVSQDNTNFFWDDTNNILKLGTGNAFYIGATGDIVSPGTDTVAIQGTVNEPLRFALKNLSSGTAAHSSVTLASDEDRYVSIGIASSGFSNPGDPFAAGEGFLDMSSEGKLGTARPLFILNRLNSYIRFGTNDTEKMRLLAGGNLIIGDTTAVSGEKLRVAGTTYLDSTVTINVGGLTINSGAVIATSSTASFAQVNAGATSRTISGGAAQVYLANASQCQLFFDVTSSAANSKLWDINPTSAGVIQFRCINDANNAANSYMSVTRSGESPTAIIFNEDSVDCDVRIESDGDANNFFSDGGANTVCIGTNSAADSAKFYVSGKISTSGEMEINGALNHDGSTWGLCGAAPSAQDTGWAVSNVTTDRTYDANSTTLDEVADVLGTLISKLIDKGVIGA